jgi:predicted alpha/beta-fold hydrolase
MREVFNSQTISRTSFQTIIQNDEHSPTIIAKLSPVLKSKPFKPLPFFSNGHAQTLLAYVYPRRYRLRHHINDEERYFEIEQGIKLLAHCRWQKDKRAKPTVLLIHGLEGSSSSVYMISAAEKFFREGFNAVRLNMRTCGGTEHLTPTVYHSGMYSDFLKVINQLIDKDNLKNILLVGFSMSANMVLHLAGRRADDLPDELKALCAISPAVDVKSSIDALHLPSNRIYHNKFLRSLCKRIKRKHQLSPDLYDITKLNQVKTITDFDEIYTAHHAGYENAVAYYKGVSSLPVLKDIRKPTLIIHAQDDPFIPFYPLTDSSIQSNPNILLICPEHGGHVGFITAKNDFDSDRFWMENRLIEFCSLTILHAGQSGTSE